ncbi:MAG: helix-turn-helix domain-containing protein, partial [Muribaculaceae bacterium]|nr:helix-turn-helix domain-containing protein [Muribaculaceae bacterium]
SILCKCAVVAYRNLGNLYSTHSLDYRQAYRYLYKALKIAQETHNDYQLAYIHTSLANLYNADKFTNTLSDHKNCKHLIAGIEAAKLSDNERALATLGTNLAHYAVVNDSLTAYLPLLQSLADYPYSDKYRERTEGAVRIIMGCRKWAEGDSVTAERLLREALTLNANHPMAERYRTIVYDMLSYLHSQGSNYPKAISLLRHSLLEAEEGEYKDLTLELYQRLAQLYRNSGRNDSARIYYDRYLWLKDTLTNTAGYGAVRSLDFMTDIERMGQEIDEAHNRYREQRRRTLWVIALSAFLGIILVMVIWIYRRLQRTNRILYRNLQETSQREQQLQLLRQQLEEERNVWQSQSGQKVLSQQEPVSETETETNDKKDIHEEESTVTTVPTAVPDKELLAIYARTIAYMDSNTTIYQSGFSLNDLAAALGISRQTLSKSINICHGSNFPQLLNEYRLREVMRLMDDTANSGLTIESIAELAGFKSSTSFTALFKNRTGLTPAAYLRMSRSR